MGIFYILLILILVLGTISDLLSKKFKIISWISFIGLTIILALVSGLRNNIGDTGAYIHLFKNISPDFEVKGYEEGFVYFLTFLKEINSDPQFMIFITGVITTA